LDRLSEPCHLRLVGRLGLARERNALLELAECRHGFGALLRDLACLHLDRLAVPVDPLVLPRRLLEVLRAGELVRLPRVEGPLDRGGRRSRPARGGSGRGSGSARPRSAPPSSRRSGPAAGQSARAGVRAAGTWPHPANALGGTRPPRARARSVRRPPTGDARPGPLRSRVPCPVAPPGGPPPSPRRPPAPPRALPRTRRARPRRSPRPPHRAPPALRDSTAEPR